MLKVIKYLFSKDIPLYKQVFRNLENEPFTQAIKNVWNLSKIGMCDQQLWSKTEYVFKKWQNHLNMEDLIQFAHLLSLNQRFVSPQLKVSYEYRIKKCKTKPNESQIETLILKLLPLMNEGCKQYLIQQYLESQTMCDESQLKCMIQILENTKSHRNRIVEKLNYLSSLKEYQNIQEIILYLQIFYSDIPKQWHNEVLIREKIQEGMCEILQGFKVPSQLDKCELQLVIQPLDRIYQQMLDYKQDDFKFFMALLQIVKAYQYSNTEFKNKEDLSQLLTSIYKKLVPKEVISIIEILYNEIDLVDFLNKYLDFSLENIDNKTIINFIFSNNQFIKNADIAKRLIDKLSITITQGEQLADIQLCLTQSSALFPNLNESIQPLLKQNVSLMLKYCKISNKISFNAARQLTLNQKLEHHQIQQIWRKVKFLNLEEVDQNLKRLRKDVQEKNIDPETLTAIHDSMKDCFKLQMIH